MSDNHLSLTSEERAVIEDKATEAPFSGEYHDYFGNGVYACKRCDVPLYRSLDKFNASCGWPSFDDELPVAVRREPDADGRRTEIVCEHCDGHLGHVFHGEQYTDKNTRHCVNSLSMRFYAFLDLLEKARAGDDRYGVAIIAGGCFWGIEYYFSRAEGVLATAAGYTGGQTGNPSYAEVCQGLSGHAECVAVVFDKTKTDIIPLYQLFFELHDFENNTSKGKDEHGQYRSAIFYLDSYQRQAAEQVINELKQLGYDPVTQRCEYDQFWLAEDDHQKYYDQQGMGATCCLRKPLF